MPDIHFSQATRDKQWAEAVERNVGKGPHALVMAENAVGLQNYNRELEAAQQIFPAMVALYQKVQRFYEETNAQLPEEDVA